MVGTTLAGRYRIVRRLGRGAMGAVYLGEHIKFGRLDAIKVLQASMARDQEATRRFLRGARNASAINHRNVCTVYDFSDTDDGLQFLAMEYVDGETLADLLEREGALPFGRAVSIVAQVAAALQAAHDLGIVHRDLKPGNVMLTRERDGSDLVKVVDFDIAKGSREGEGAEVTRLGFVVGTPEYMSPEQLTGDPLDGRSDVYSLGLLLFRLLTGKLPMRSASTQELLVERLTQDPLTLRDVVPGLEVPPRIQQVLDRALQRRREDRYPTALDLARDLEAALTTPSPALAATLEAPVSPPSDPVSAHAPPTPEVPATRVSGARSGSPSPPGRSRGPQGRGASRRPLAWGLGGAGVVGVALVVFVIVKGGGGPEPGPPPGPGDGGRNDSLLTQTETDTAVADTSTPGPGPEGGGGGGGGERGGGGGGEGGGGGGGGGQAGPGRAPFSPSETGDVAFRQFERLEGATPAILQSVMDTAAIIMEMDTAPASAHALAAYVLGDANFTRGDTAAAIRWLERALTYDPDHRASLTLLRRIRGGGGP